MWKFFVLSQQSSFPMKYSCHFLTFLQERVYQSLFLISRRITCSINSNFKGCNLTWTTCLGANKGFSHPSRSKWGHHHLHFIIGDLSCAFRELSLEPNSNITWSSSIHISRHKNSSSNDRSDWGWTNSNSSFPLTGRQLNLTQISFGGTTLQVCNHDISVHRSNIGSWALRNTIA